MSGADTLYPYWARFATLMNWPWSQAEQMYQSVAERYDEPQRHFHTRAHLEKIFKTLNLDTYAPEDQAVLIAATFWHDAIYETSSVAAIRANEENSAQLAEQDLSKLGTEPAFIARVTQIIRNSRTHLCDPKEDPVCAAFLDTDMATLAGTWVDYRVGMECVYKEYETIPLEDFYQGRLELFIEPLLAAPRIYLLDENEERWGDSARANLRCEKANILARHDGNASSVKKQPRPE